MNAGHHGRFSAVAGGLILMELPTGCLNQKDHAVSKLLDLIKRHEGFRAAPYWDKTGQEIWQGLTTEVHKLRTSWAQKEFKEYCKDELGHLTIGYGLNLEAEWPEEFWDYVLEWQIGQAVEAAHKYDWFLNLGWSLLKDTDLCTARQAVIIAMIYLDQQGQLPGGLPKRMIVALEDRCELPGMLWYRLAAEEIEASKLDAERAQVLAEMMRTGEWPMDEAA